MSPLELFELLQELKSEIAEINRSWIVVDDSQLILNLSESITDDNAMLVGVLPSYGTKGNSLDSYRNTTVTQLLIVEKTAYGDITQDEFIQVFQRTYLIAVKIKEAIIRKATADCILYLAGLEINSIDFDPVWRKGECNGWSIDLEIT